MTMTFIVAVAGKGGVGKSTISALLVKELARRSGKVVLAVDADPNSNLGEKLGAEVERTIGDLREDLLRRSEELTAGGSKQEAMMYQLRLAMVEGREFDLVTMGRSEGRGCYCYINTLLRTYLDEIMGDYPYVVIDNEAGMEHLSRRTCQRMDVLLVVSDPTKVGLTTAGRILELAREMELSIGTAVLVINRVRGDLPSTLKDAIPSGFARVMLVPHDREVEDLSSTGGPMSSLPAKSVAVSAVYDLAEDLR
ncbi:MAG: AAA family ATPase [Methanomassiliicoccus sp.]|nr:AAA family ATPase [Methanomassiliicoccus sp.]